MARAADGRDALPPLWIVAPSRGRIEAGVERESLLGFQLVLPGSASRAEEQIPAFLSDRTGNDDERVAFQQRASEGLLPLARCSRSQPSRIFSTGSSGLTTCTSATLRRRARVRMWGTVSRAAKPLCTATSKMAVAGSAEQ